MANELMLLKSRDITSDKVVDTYTVPTEHALENPFQFIPRQMQSIIIAGNEFFHCRSQARISGTSGVYTEIQLVYQPYNKAVKVNSNDATRDVFEQEFSLQVDYITKDIQTHINYKSCWSNDLYAYVPANYSGSVPIPSWWATAVSNTGFDIVDYSGIVYQFAQSYPAASADGGKWRMVAFRTKPGVESYDIPRPIVTERKKFDTKKGAAAYCFNGGRVMCLMAPDDTFLWPADWNKWIRKPQGVEGGQAGDGYASYTAIIKYEYADLWDQEIYV